MATETVQISTFDTDFGAVTVASTENGVVCSSLPGGDAGAVRGWVQRHVDDAVFVEGGLWNAKPIKAVRDYLAGKRPGLDDVAVDMRGTTFQLKVWNELRGVPYGATISYADLARQAGHPGASRACGTANGSNPLPLFTPCHRVIASNGSLGGFGGGLELKRRLPELEGSLQAVEA